MSFDRAIRFKTSKPDSNNNASIFKANGKVFQSVSALSKYTETFAFGPDHLVMLIDAIKYCNLFALRLSGIYAKIAQIFLDDKSWKAAN